MRHALRIAMLALLVAAPAAAADAGPTAKARLAACQPGLEQEERAAAFTADMRAIPGAARLQVKFALQARTEEEPDWTAVAAPGFGIWISSEPGVARFVYTKTVENLLAPASYRTLVRFRWLSASGRTLLRARRTSKACRQPDLRPDLVADRLTHAGDAYEVTIANAGRTAADSFTVTIEIDGRVHHLGYVEHLDARAAATVRGQAPPCRPGTDVIVRVDADNAVDEADEDANALAQACPAAAGQ